MLIYKHKIKNNRARMVYVITLQDNEKIEMDKLIKLVGKIKAIIYARVSTIDQALHGHSLESQIEKCKDRAISKFGYKEDELLALVEGGGMGDDPNRPMLNHALYLLEKGVGKKIIILHPDRLARDNTLQGQLSRRIWNLGVDIEFVEFEVNPNDPESMLMYNIQGSISQYNKAKILANSKRGRTQKAKKGEIPIFSRLYGYTYDKEKDMLFINETEKEVLLEMKSLLLEKNKSTTQIAKILSSRGIPAPKGDVWHSTSVLRMLRNETYKGTYWYGKTKIVQTQGKRKSVKLPKEEWIGIPIEPIFNNLEFEMMQQKIDSFRFKKGRPSDDYLLRGLVYCGRCGYAARSGITSKTSEALHKYYACTMKKSRSFKVGTGEGLHNCKGKNWRVDYVDDTVWETVVSYINSPDKLLEEFTKEQSDTNKLNSMVTKKEKLESKLESIKKEENRYILLFGKGKITEEQLDELTDPLNKQMSAINEELDLVINQLATYQNKFDSFELLKENIKKYQSLINENKLDIVAKRELINILVRKVYLNDDNSVKIVLTWDVSDIEHKNAYNHRHKGSVFYVSVNKKLTKANRPSYKDFVHLWDEIYDMHYNQLIPFNQIRKKFGMTKRTLQKLFEVNNCEIIRNDKLYEIKVSKDSKFICDLIYKQKRSIRSIIRDYNFSVEYIKKAIEIEERKNVIN